jgi:hypothetical protein
MIRTHFEGIVAWAQTRQTNGFIEALNGLFQAAKRKARGYTRFATMRTVLFLIAGKLDFAPDQTTRRIAHSKIKRALFLDILAGHAGRGIVASLVGQRARRSEALMRSAADGYTSYGGGTPNPPALLQISAAIAILRLRRPGPTTKAPYQIPVVAIARIRRLGHTCFRGAPWPKSVSV